MLNLKLTYHRVGILPIGRWWLALILTVLALGQAAAQNLPSPGFKAITLPGGTITGVVGAGVPLEGSATQPSPSSLIAPIPANASRVGWWFFQNQSGAALTVVLDDGADTASTKSFFVMAPGGAVGAQGASMGSADTGPHRAALTPLAVRTATAL